MFHPAYKAVTMPNDKFQPCYSQLTFYEYWTDNAQSLKWTAHIFEWGRATDWVFHNNPTENGTTYTGSRLPRSVLNTTNMIHQNLKLSLYSLLHLNIWTNNALHDQESYSVLSSFNLSYAVRAHLARHLDMFESALCLIFSLNNNCLIIWLGFFQILKV